MSIFQLGDYVIGTAIVWFFLIAAGCGVAWAIYRILPVLAVIVVATPIFGGIAYVMIAIFGQSVGNNIAVFSAVAAAIAFIWWVKG